MKVSDFHPLLPAALRRVEQHWPECHQTLLFLNWEVSYLFPYGATDARRLLLNPLGLAEWAETEADPVGAMAFLLVHEARHVDLLHPLRFALAADHDTANRAGDYVINGEIHRVNNRVQKVAGFTPFPLPDLVLFDTALSSGRWSATEVYRILLAEGEQPDQPGNKPEPPDQPGEQPDQPGEQPDQPGDQPGKPGDQPGKPGDQPGKPGKGRPGTAGGGDLLRPKPGEGETQADADKAAEDLVEAVKLNRDLNVRAGVGGGTSQRDLQSNADPVGVDWRTVLAQWMDASARTGWDRPFNAQLWGGAGLVGPGRARRTIGDLVVVVDTSGSLGDDALGVVLAEISGLAQAVAIDRLVIVSHDHEVGDVFEIAPGGAIPSKLKGGGGTLFGPVLDWIEENAAGAVGAVWITDGDTADWGTIEAPAIPVLWGHIPNRWFQPSGYPFGTVFEVPVSL